MLLVKLKIERFEIENFVLGGEMKHFLWKDG
jgi:hypothetical protein